MAAFIIMCPSVSHSTSENRFSQNANQRTCLSQSLGVCVCSDTWAGSDCSVPLDPNSLVWETLLDTQLTEVRTVSTAVFICVGDEFCTPANFNTCKLLPCRTRPTGSSTEWGTLWCLDHRATFGCMEGSLCQREFWEMCTGRSK